MARACKVIVIGWLICGSVCAQDPSISTKVNHPRSARSHSQAHACRLYNAQPCGPTCAHARCAEDADPFPGITELRGRQTQLMQHLPYESPLEASYFYRPYSYMGVLSQQSRSTQSLGVDSKNPYDNRGLQAIYKNK